MSKIRKLFRGSGRALALIFVASVVWLLFDMAALKFSFSESNAKVLKEEMVRRERERGRLGRPPEKSPGRPGEEPRLSLRGLGRGHKYEGYKGEGAGRDKEQERQKRDQERSATSKAPTKKMVVLHRIIPLKLWSPQPSVPIEKTVGGNLEKEINSSSLLGTKQALLGGFQQSQLVASVGRPLVKVTHSVATVGNKVTHRLFTEGSRGRKEVLFKVGLVDKGSLTGLKQELPTGSKPEKSQAKPLLQRTPASPVNETGMKETIRNAHSVTKGLNFPVGKAHNLTKSLDLPVSKPATSEAAEKPTASINPAGPGHQPKDDAKKEVPLEDQVVFISKEGAQIPANQSRKADAEGNFTNSLIGKNTPKTDSKSKMPLKDGNITKAAASRETILVGYTALGKVHKVNFIDKDQLQEINQSDRVIPLTERPQMHKVLTIDRTIAPRDPKAPGQFGRPAVVPSEKQEEAKKRWNEGNFNVYLSDLIPVDRAIDDTRPSGCSDLLVHNDLPTTSIIMCFVDEVWSALLRSVHSVLNRSPPQFIKEIILVDDFSTKAYLKDQLDQYMSKFPKVRVLHLKERHGLIRARLAGAEIAKGDVLTFLDSHVECNVGWLEPLLDRIYLNRKKVACPVIEVISDKDMSYMTVDSFQRGIFTWPMNFGWKPIPPDVIEKNKIKDTDIIRCPVMAGGLFSIDKKYFFELGTYDPGLDVWGGENMEISFKVWMCGGEIEIIPCSRVGHIFRNDNPYSFPKDRITTVERNLARVAEVWMDEYKDLFYGHGYHLILKNLDVGNLTQQIELRKRLQCKSFKWYLENVYPDIEAPLVKARGLNQQFNYTWLRLIQHGDLCVALTDAKGTLGLHPCDKRNNSLKWLHKSLVAFHPELMDHIVLERLPQATCLEVDQSKKALRVNNCSPSNPYQKWQFGNYYAD
ncbi:polypeptide N-acetylgalactosaminyltransferase 5 isoform X2 [Eublepharis macularius]|uniref:Polypeptide N-acetylgalactosaminyltransferase n=1 Tax=Eublepharis macularius TaxID=481883 RepID=A0AA97IX83_EUBMA|nr:polypeptide N-acetylgalactosaminyltransferase 5 isoform X2 [Eublepharis macularius]